MGKHRADRNSEDKGSEDGVSRRYLLRTGGTVAGLGAAAVFLGRGADMTEESWRRHWKRHPFPRPSATSSSASPSPSASGPSASPSPASPPPTPAPSDSTSSAPPPSAATGKVVRAGTGLQLNGSPFRMVGLSIWQATVNTWNAPLNGYVPVNAGTTLQTWLADIRATAPHVNVIRTWFFQQFAINAGARDWSAFDKVLSVCDAAGFKVIAALEDNWAYERQGSQLPQLTSSWFSGGYSTTVLPREQKTYRAWVAEAVAHYSGDPRIAVWEMVAEPNAITTGFAQDVSALIRSLDPHTPICCGEVGPLSAAIYSLPDVDLASYHYYTNYGQTNWQAVQQAAAAAGKPWYMGECGFDPSGSRPQEFQSLMSGVFGTANCAGVIAWQFANQGGDEFNIATGDPALPVLNSFA